MTRVTLSVNLPRNPWHPIRTRLLTPLALSQVPEIEITEVLPKEFRL